jgi:hypothetical protein
MRQVSDTTQPLSLRLEAAANLTTQCRDHRAFQTLRTLIDQANDDLALRQAIVEALPAWEEGFLPNTALVHALSLPGLRDVAIETLEKMGPVTGPKESRLLTQLESLKPGASKHYRVSAMPGVFGRDHRVLDYLRRMLQTGSPWERALAASELCGLGEVETSLDAALDPEPRVRNSLARAIGEFRESRGAQVLNGLLDDPDSRVAQQAAKSLARLGAAESSVRAVETAASGWMPLLKEISEFRLTDTQLAARLPKEMIESQWLGAPGASEAQIQALEERIGRPLPPSYRTFLETSNGFRWPSSFIPRMLGAEEVEYFRVRNAGWAAAYRDTYPNLGDCLEVSAVGDAAVILLNLNGLHGNGEGGAYFFANWVPGARPYPSLYAFLEWELDHMCEWRSM